MRHKARPCCMLEAVECSSTQTHSHKFSAVEQCCLSGHTQGGKDALRVIDSYFGCLVVVLHLTQLKGLTYIDCCLFDWFIFSYVYYICHTLLY